MPFNLAALVRWFPGLRKLPGKTNLTGRKRSACKQIKILALTASPEDSQDLDYEKEQDILLEAFEGFDRASVYLDMPDPVGGTLQEIAENLESGHHDILLITAHGGIDAKGEGFLAFEDSYGHEKGATGKALAGILKGLADPPQIVILSACHSADARVALMPAAQALYDAGVETVIGMNNSISHDAAIVFFLGFFDGIVSGQTVKESFQAGQRVIFQKAQQARKENPNYPFKNEDQIPQLLSRKEDLTKSDFNDHVIDAPLPPQSHHFPGVEYRERGFIGRRQVLRRIYGMVEERVGAIVLKGPGGIGKSTLTTRAVGQLRRQGYDFIVIQGETSPEGILHKISQKLSEPGQKFSGGAGHAARAAAESRDETPEQKFSEGPGNPFTKGFPGRRGHDVSEDSIYSSTEMDIKEKLSWYIDNFLLQTPMLIIFDNFEENQAEQAEGELRSHELKEFLSYFRDSLRGKCSMLFFSTRYTIPGFDVLEIGEFSPVEFRKMVMNGRALQRLEGKAALELNQEIGGNPRAIELLDSIAWLKFEERSFGWDDLQALFDDFRRRMIEEASSSDGFKPLFLEKLFSYLTQSQREALEALSIFRYEVGKQALAALGLSLEMDDRRRPVSLSLLEYKPAGEMYYVHRLTAKYALARLAEETRKTYHIQAAGYFAGIEAEKGVHILEDLIESRWHYLQAEEWDRAADITFALEDYLTLHGSRQKSFDLLQELVDKPLSETNRGVVIGQIGNLYYIFGNYDKAIESHLQAKDIFERLDDRKNFARSLHQIGIIYQRRGEYDAALVQYQASLEIKEKIGDIAGAAKSLHQIGMIYEDRGEYDAALDQYKASLDIKEKIGDIAGKAISLHQIGMIYEARGEYDAALVQYQASLEIKEKIGDISGKAQSMHQIGNVYEKRGEYDAALEQYQKSLEIREKIDDIPGKAQSLHQIGMINQKRGDYDAALDQYQKSLEIFEKIGDIAGEAISLHQIGNVYYLRGEYDAALDQYQASLEIAKKIGDIPGMAITFGQMGQFYFSRNDLKTALKYSLKALSICDKIGSPMANQAKRDIARIQEKMSKEEFEKLLEKLIKEMEGKDRS